MQQVVYSQYSNENCIAVVIYGYGKFAKIVLLLSGEHLEQEQTGFDPGPPVGNCLLYH